MPIEHIFQTAFWFSIKLIGHGPRNLTEQQGWNLVLDKPSKSLNVLPIIAKWGSSLIQFVQNKGFVVLSKTVLGAKHNFPWHGVGGVIGLFSALPFSPSPGFFLPSFFSSGITGIRGFRGGTHTEVRLKYWGRSKSGTYREQWETEKILNIFFVWSYRNNKKTSSQSSEFWRLKRFTQAVSPCQKWL